MTARPTGPDGGRRPVVVVLGMHRSGTSLLASLLQAVGVELGPDLLLDQTPDNEAGYWEHKEIAEAQEAILSQLGRTWYLPEGQVPLPAGWWRLPEMRPHRRRLADIVRRETSETVGPWGFKDPRTVRLLPLWLDIFADLGPQLGIEPVWLLAIRNPEAVAQSLAKRDRMSMAAAQLLWLDHTLDAFRYVGDRIAAVVDYDDWFARPLATARATIDRLGLAWPADDAALDAAVGRIVRADLRHGRGQQPASLLPEVRELYGLLRAGAPDAPPADAVRPLIARLDQARCLLAGWGEYVARHPEREAAMQRLGRDFEEMRGQFQTFRAQAKADIAQQRTRAEAFARDHAQLQELYAVLDGRRLAAEAEMAALHRRIGALVAERDAMEAQRTGLLNELAARQRILDQVMPDPARALDDIWNSTSLRVARPLQRLVGGRAAVERPPTPTPEDQARLAVALQQGFFWNLTGPLRAAARLLRRGRP
ncbi:sulfotransferase family protein [Allostella sp. ATCC 35155]|nr:sulfotransferase family protein [Stella sp. ATCC 35155]